MANTTDADQMEREIQEALEHQLAAKRVLIGTQAPPPNRPNGYPDDNPKTEFGLAKPPMHAVPPMALMHLGKAMEHGKRKYGLMNWRQHKISSSVYYDAMMRHLFAFWDGEDIDIESGCHHMAHVMACAALWLDARHNAILNDDRPTVSGRAAHATRGWEAEIVRTYTPVTQKP